MIYTRLWCCVSFAAIAIAASVQNPFCGGGIPASYASNLTDFRPAEVYCTESYPVPNTTSTTTASTTTVTLMVTTEKPYVTIATVTDTITPSTETVISLTDTNTATITVDTTFITTFWEATETSTSTRYTMPTVTEREIKKTGLPDKPNLEAIIHFASLTKSEPQFIGSVCSCLETPVTNHATVTPSTTLSLTATSPYSVTATATATATGTRVVSATTTITTATSVTATSTITRTSTITSVSTVTIETEYRGPDCNPYAGQDNPTGCSDPCVCHVRIPQMDENPLGVCDNASGCTGTPCQSDRDCASDEACAYYCFGHPSCAKFNGCTSTWVPDPDPSFWTGLWGQLEVDVNSNSREE